MLKFLWEGIDISFLEKQKSFKELIEPETNKFVMKLKSE